MAGKPVPVPLTINATGGGLGPGGGGRVPGKVFHNLYSFIEELGQGWHYLNLLRFTFKIKFHLMYCMCYIGSCPI